MLTYSDTFLNGVYANYKGNNPIIHTIPVSYFFDELYLEAATNYNAKNLFVGCLAATLPVAQISHVFAQVHDYSGALLYSHEFSNAIFGATLYGLVTIAFDYFQYGGLVTTPSLIFTGYWLKG